jgi:SAM-dependent methyltransferase
MMKYKSLTKQEEDKVIIEIIETLLDPSLPFSGEHRRKQWEKGWSENLKSGDTTPKYFGKYPVTRFNGEFVIGQNEQESLYSILDGLFEKYLYDKTTICEFGCGTGHNLIHIRDKYILPIAQFTYRFIGLDWSQSSNKLVRSLGMEGYNFDYFKPKFDMPRDSAVLTVASLEQVGKKYKKFVKYLLRSNPRVVVHIEPIPELLDKTNLLDYLSIKYMQKRRYLSGYLDYLRLLEKNGYIKILEAKRSGIGSKFIDGYSVVVWRPL